MANDEQHFIRQLEAASQAGWSVASPPARWPRVVTASTAGDVLDLLGDPANTTRFGFACLIAKDTWTAELEGAGLNVADLD
jgi:hypothetical protein